MGKRRRESDSDVAATSTAQYGTVFVDTSLDTHLAVHVSDSDTVSDFKEKISVEHMQCFPSLGGIKIQSLKVKRRSNFYYLPDTVLVWSAFQGVKGSWFVSVEASSAHRSQLNPNSSGLGSDCVKVKDVDDCRGLLSDTNKREALPVTLPNDAHAINEVSGMTAGLEFGKSLDRTTNFHRDTFPEENCVEAKPRAKKKQKMRHTEDVCHDTTLSDSHALLHASSDVRDVHSNVEVSAENSNLDSDKRKEDAAALEGMNPENFVTCEPEHELCPDFPTESLGVTSNAAPDHYTRSMDATDVKKDVNSDGNKTKKVPSKIAVKIHGKTHVAQTGRDESTILCTETYESEEKKEDKDFSLHHDHEIHAVPLDAPAVGEPEIFTDNRKKRKKKSKKKRKKKMGGEEKPTDANPENSGIEQTINGICGSSGLVSSSVNHIPEAGDEEESTFYHALQDVQKKLLDGSSKDTDERVRAADGNDRDFVPSTQAVQTLEDVTSAEKMVEKKAEISLGNSNDNFLHMEKDQIAGFIQVDKNGKNTENKDKKVKKKRKRVQLSAADVKMKDVDDSGLSSDVNRMETLQMTIPNDAHETNHVSSDVKKDQLNADDIFGSDKRKENMELEGMIPENSLAGKLECKPGQNVPTESCGVSSNEAPDHFTRSIDGGGVIEVLNSNNSKRKKKKTHKMAADIQDRTHVEQTGKSEDAKPYTEIHKPEENEDKSLSLKHGHEVTIPSNENYSDTAVPNPAQKPIMDDAHAVVDSDISSGSKKKKKKMMKNGGNSSARNPEKLGIEQQINGISGSSGLICPSADHIPKASDKEESILHRRVQDVQTELLDCPDKDATEKDQGADGNGANLVLSTQTSQMLEDVASADKIVGKKALSTTGNLHEYVVTMGKDQIVRFNQVEKHDESTENKDKKDKKKRKKVQHSASDVSENLPVKVQEAGVEVSATEENLVNLVRSEKEGRHVASFSALSNKIDGKVGEVSMTAGEMHQKKTLQKPDDTHAASLNKSSLERSKKNAQTVASAAKLAMKTPRKRSLLTKPGEIFQDNSGGSSGGENGNPCSEASIHTPSDSSLSSDSESVGESDLSQDSTRNGSNDAEVQSIGRRHATIIDALSGSKEVTMDMILRSSKRFKDAKLLASQNELENESQLIELVPESQPI